MKRTGSKIMAAAVTALFAIAAAAGAADSGWAEVGKIFGQEGKALPGGVQKYGWPRRDLRVMIGEVRVQPALALGSWAAFHSEGERAMAMGDLALVESEVNPVIRALRKGGLEVLAVHNHLLSESPRVVYVHFIGKGDASTLAQGIKSALARTETPMLAGPPSAPGPAEKNRFAAFASALGREGTFSGTVLQVAVPRAEAITEGGMEIPPSMGMAESINVQATSGGVATTGDFVLAADEVNPVIDALETHGIAVTALHSHMLRESPRLFFMHFWAAGDAAKIGEGLKAALSKVATK